MMISKLKVPLTILIFTLTPFFGCSHATPDNTAPDPKPASSDSSNTDSQTNILLTEENWDIPYDGFGSVSFDTVNGIVLQPKASVTPNETHAALALSKLTEQFPVSNFKVTVKVTTEQQLRTPVPNPWECFWIFFNYTIGTNGKKITNYFTLKTNGSELGTAYDEVGQTFLVTNSAPVLQIGTANEITLTKQGQQLQVTIDGKVAMTYDGATMPTPLIDTAGAIGLYTEDARVRIQTVSIEPLP